MGFLGDRRRKQDMADALSAVRFLELRLVQAPRAESARTARAVVRHLEEAHTLAKGGRDPESLIRRYYALSERLRRYPGYAPQGLIDPLQLAVAVKAVWVCLRLKRASAFPFGDEAAQALHRFLDVIHRFASPEDESLNRRAGELLPTLWAEAGRSWKAWKDSLGRTPVEDPDEWRLFFSAAGFAVAFSALAMFRPRNDLVPVGEAVEDAAKRQLGRDFVARWQRDGLVASGDFQGFVQRRFLECSRNDNEDMPSGHWFEFTIAAPLWVIERGEGRVPRLRSDASPMPVYVRGFPVQQGKLSPAERSLRRQTGEALLRFEHFWDAEWMSEDPFSA